MTKLTDLNAKSIKPGDRNIPDGTIAGMLMGNMHYDRTMQQVTDYENKIEALTIRQIQEAFARHIQTDLLVLSVAGDFANADKYADTEEEAK